MFLSTAAILLLASVGALVAGNMNATMPSIVVFYETLCPDSQKFVNTQLTPTWEKAGGSLNFTLVPYGKTTTNKENGSVTFTCHHGPDECVGNKVHACILDGSIVPMFANQIKLIDCLMQDGKKSAPYPTKQCVMKLNMTDSVADDLDSCANSTKGTDLLVKMGEITAAFEAPLVNVPAVTINGVKDTAAISNLQSAICSKITGDKPQMCPSKSGASTIFTFSLVPVVIALVLAKL